MTDANDVFAYVQDVSAGWHEYERIAAAVGDDQPDGMIVHLAGPTPEGYRIIDVWRSRAHWEAYRDGRLRPALRALAGDSEAQGSRFQPLSVRHVMTSAL